MDSIGRIVFFTISLLIYLWAHLERVVASKRIFSRQVYIYMQYRLPRRCK